MTGEPHPSAEEIKVLTHKRHPGVANDDDTTPCHIYICGDTLAILFGDHDADNTEVVIWNWKTGQVLLVGY